MASLDFKINSIVNMLKHTYSTPEAELLEIRFEENYLATSDNFSQEESTEKFIEDDEVNL